MEAVRLQAQRAFSRLTQPFSNLLIRVGVTPNALTTMGAGLVLASAVAFGVGRIRLGGALLILSGVVDMLDGQVARAAGQATRFGAFYDSNLDRVGDGATFIGLAIYLLGTPEVASPGLGVVACMLALLSSQLVSYARARAEGLGLECKVGLLGRAERLGLIGIPTLLVGPGDGGQVILLFVTLVVLGSSITVLQRFWHVYRVTAADRG